MNSLSKKLLAFLERQGYQVEQKSVHGKNQTRFFHFVVQKAGNKYFCKINKSGDVFREHNNSSLSANFAQSPRNIHFMAPLETFYCDPYLIHLYPYVDQPAVSTESKKFKDFNVGQDNLDVYLESVIKAIEFVTKQKIITDNESKLEVSFEQKFIQRAESMRTDTPNGLELLQFVLKEGKMLRQQALAINDIQPQNMFWVAPTKELYLFDLELLGPNYTYHDYARFSSYLWFVYERPAYAKRFLQLAFARDDLEQQKEKYRYIKFQLVWLLLNDYRNFEAVNTRRHIADMLAWVRKDMLHFVNEIVKNAKRR